MNDDIACGKIFHKPIHVEYSPWEDHATMIAIQAKKYQEAGRERDAQEAIKAATSLKEKKIVGFLTALTFDDVIDIRYHIKTVRTRLEKRASLIPVEDRASPDATTDTDISETIATAYVHLVVWKALKRDERGKPGGTFFSSENDVVEVPEPVIMAIYMDYLRTFSPSEDEMRPMKPVGVVH